MVYKKYIKRDGKIYGPYKYHSRKINGKVITEYRGKAVKKKKINTLFLILGFILVFSLIFVLNYDKIDFDNGIKITKSTFNNIITPITKSLTGFVISDNLDNESFEETPIINESQKENQTIIDNLNESVNVSQNNQSIINETNISSENNISIDINEALTNVTENITNITETEVKINIKTIQYQAVLGQPVKWKKQVSLDKSGKTKIKLPKEATEITVNKVEGEQKAEFSITGAVIGGEREPLLLKLFRKIFGALTGLAIQENIHQEKEIEIDDTATEYNIEYETPAPYAVEEELERGKRVKIVGPETVHYENVLAFTNLDESLNLKDLSRLKIYWVEDNSYINPSSVEDRDNNGIYDYIEWIVPQLSNQTFEIIIEIIKAEHLDSNRQFISDIYEEVKELDDIWSETINNNEYVRVTFEVPLDSSRDITIYPRVVSGNPKIEVYEIDGTELIAEFTSINSNQYNKVLLTNLQGSQDVFDLRILDGNVEFDYIVDPQYASPASDIDSGTWTSTPLWEKIDDPLDDGVYVISAKTATSEAFKVGLSSITDPGVHNDHTLKIRASYSGVSGTIRFELLQGEGVIRSSGDLSLGSTFQEYSFTLLEAEAASITDYAALSVRITAVATANNKYQWVSWARFEVPELADTNIPQFSALDQSPANNTAFSNQGTYYKINSTITFTNGTAGIEMNSVNYSATNDSAAFTVAITNLTAGIYDYFWWAFGNGTSMLYNKSETITYNVTKSADSCSVYFNESSPQTFPKTFIVWTNCTSPYNLYRNETPIGNDSEQGFEAGAYNFSVMRTDTENYTNYYHEQEFRITPTTGQVSLFLNGNADNQTVKYPTEANVSALTDYGTIALYQNGTTITANNNLNITRAANYYNMTAVSTGDQNHSSASLTYWLTVTKGTPALTKYLNTIDDNLPIDYPTNVNASALASEGTVAIYRNGTNVTNENNVDVSLAVNYYEYEFNITGNANYSDVSGDLLYATISKGTPTGSLDSDEGWEVTYPTDVNVSYSETIDGDDDLGYEIFENGTSVGGTKSGVRAGATAYGYIFNTTAGANWSASASMDAQTLIINKNTTSCSVYFNESSPQTFPKTFIVWTNCTSPYNLYRNETPIGNDSEQGFEAGAYNFSVMRTDAANYTNYYHEQEFQIAKSADLCGVQFSEESPLEYPGTFWVWSNCSGDNYLRKNGTIIANYSEQSLGVGAWNFSTNRTDTANYSDIYGEREFRIVDTTKPTWTDNQTNQTIEGLPTIFAIKYNDNLALESNGGYIFSTNNSGVWVNDSLVMWTSTPEWANVSKILPANVGNLTQYRWFANDSVGNINNSDVFNVTTTSAQDLIHPYFTTIPNNVSGNYLVANVNADFDATDAVGFGGFYLNDTSNFTIDYSTGVLTNNSGLFVDSYALNVTINDTFLNINWTTFTVVVSQAVPQGSLSGTASITYGTQGNVDGTESNTGDADVGYKLYRNGTEVDDPDISTLAVNFYSYIYNASAGYNYTANASMDTFDLTVNQNPDVCGVEFNETSPLSYPGTFWVWSNCSGDNYLRKNGTIIANYSEQSLGIGAYNFSTNRTDTVNYSDIYGEREFRIVDTTKPTFTTIPNNVSGNYLIANVNADFEATDAVGFGGFYINDTSNFTIDYTTGVLTNSSPLFTDSYALNVTINDTSLNINWTIFTVAVNQIIPQGSLSGTASIIYGTAGNVDGAETNTGDADVGYKLYRNGTEVDDPDISTLAVNFYSYIYNASAGYNYTANASMDTFDLTVNQNPDVCGVYFNTSSPITFPETFIVYTNCSTDYTLRQNESTISNATTVNSGVGAFNFSVQRTDTINYSSTYSDEEFSVTQAVPTGSLTNTTAWTINTGTETTIGLSVSNVEDGGVTYVVYRDGVSKTTGETWTPVIGSYDYILNTTGGGNYTANASMDTETLTVQDGTNPTVTLNSPTAFQNFSTASITFNCTAYDNFNITNVSLYIDSAINETNDTGVSNNTFYYFTKIVSEAVHNWSCEAYDNSSNSFTATYQNFTVDLTSPTWIGNQTNTTEVSERVTFAIQYNDNFGLDSGGGYIFSINNSGVWANDSLIMFSSTPEWANVSKILPANVGNLTQYRWFANDSVGNINNSDVFNVTTTGPDEIPPYFTQIPANVSGTYGIANVNADFNADDETSVGGFYINDTSNFTIGYSTGVLTNSSSLFVGSYALNVTVNDTSQNINFTTFTVVVSQAVPQGSLSGTASIIYGTAGNVDGAETNTGDADVNYKLYRNGTEVSDPDDSALAVNFYSYIYNASAGYNYTANASMDTFDLTVNQNPDICGVEFNETSPLSYPGAFRVWSNCSSANYLMKNGTIIANYSEQSLGIGAYNFSTNRTDTVNYSDIYGEREFRIVDTTKPTFTTIPNNVSGNYLIANVNADFNAEDAVGFGGFYLNDTSNFTIDYSTGVLTNSSPLFADSYALNVTINDTSLNINWTIFTVVVSRASPSLTLELYPSTTETYGTETYGNGTGCPTGETCNLYFANKTVVANPHTMTLGVGTWNYTYNHSITQNWSYASETGNFVISQSADICGVEFNETSPLSYPGAFRVWSNCSTANYLMKNGTIIANYSNHSLSIGAYNFSTNRTDTVNYSDIYGEREFRVVDTSPPSLTIIKPENETYLTNISLLLNYLVSNEDDVWYKVLNSTGDLVIDNITIPGNTNTTFNVSSEGSHTLYLYANNSNGETVRNVTFTVNSSKFKIYYNKWRGSNKGTSTHFNQSSYEDIQNLSGIVLENTEHGKISFNETINLTDDEDPTDNQVDISSHTNISSNRIEINSTALPNFNKSATLQLYNLTFDDPRILRDSSVCPSSICTFQSYSTGTGTLIFNVTQFTVYSAEETPSDVTPSDNGGNGGGGGGISYECSRDADCKSGQYCLDHKCYEAECFNDTDCTEDERCRNHLCVKLFDIKIIDFESPIKLGEFFDFTYLVKGMADISDDVEIHFWIEKNGEIITSGLDTIYIGDFEEKIETTKIFLPSNIDSGIYDFFVQVSYGAYKAKSYRTIEIEVSEEGVVTISPIEIKGLKLYIISVLIALAIFILLFILYLERKKIKREFMQEKRWIKKHKILVLTFSLFIVLGVLAYYLNLFELTAIWIFKGVLWFKGNVLPYLQNYILGLIVVLAVFLILILIIKNVRKVKRIKREVQYKGKKELKGIKYKSKIRKIGAILRRLFFALSKEERITGRFIKKEYKISTREDEIGYKKIFKFLGKSFRAIRRQLDLFIKTQKEHRPIRRPKPKKLHVLKKKKPVKKKIYLKKIRVNIKKVINKLSAIKPPKIYFPEPPEIHIPKPSIKDIGEKERKILRKQKNYLGRILGLIQEKIKKLKRREKRKVQKIKIETTEDIKRRARKVARTEKKLTFNISEFIKKNFRGLGRFILKEEEDLSKKVRKDIRRSKEIVEEVYIDVFTPLRRIFGRKSQKRILQEFEKDLVNTGRFTKRHLKTLEDIVNIRLKSKKRQLKKEIKDGRLDFYREIIRIKKDAIILTNELIEFLDDVVSFDKQKKKMEKKAKLYGREIKLIRRLPKDILETIKKIDIRKLFKKTGSEYELLKEFFGKKSKYPGKIIKKKKEQRRLSKESAEQIVEEIKEPVEEKKPAEEKEPKDIIEDIVEKEEEKKG